MDSTKPFNKGYINSQSNGLVLSQGPIAKPGFKSANVNDFYLKERIYCRQKEGKIKYFIAPKSIKAV